MRPRRSRPTGAAAQGVVVVVVEARDARALRVHRDHVDLVRARRHGDERDDGDGGESFCIPTSSKFSFTATFYPLRQFVGFASLACAASTAIITRRFRDEIYATISPKPKILASDRSFSRTTVFLKLARTSSSRAAASPRRVYRT